MLSHLQKYYNNSLDNLGAGDSFIWYGPRWAQAATAPSRLYKAYTTEGGVRVPFVAKFPSSFALANNLSRGITDAFATVMDLAPSLLEMAGATHPAPHYAGREVVPMRGASFMPFACGATERVHAEDHITGWETCGRAALRKGKFKIVFIPRPKGPERWQLFDLARDPGETEDLALDPASKAKLDELLKHWDEYVLETGVVPLAPELGKWLQATEEQMREDVWMEYRYWEDGARDEPEKFRKTPWKWAGGDVKK
jgi:arylsulfatase A-like enzyme